MTSIHETPRILVGLGNPGSEYQKTRHNIGQMALDYLFEHPDICQVLKPWHSFAKGEVNRAVVQWGGKEVWLLKSSGFMNETGQAIRQALLFGNIASDHEFPFLWVLHDDLDIVLGEFKIQFGKGPKVHNGLLSLYDHLKTSAFWHVRLGVDGRQGVRHESGSEYVLKPFMTEEKVSVDQEIANAVAAIVATS